MRKNKFDKPCSRCQTMVPAYEGSLLGPPWETVCTTCLPRPKEPEVYIAISLDSDGIKVAPSGFMGRSRFYAYKSACDSAGAFFDPGHKCQRATLTQVPSLAEALRLENFKVVISEEILASIEKVEKDQSKEREAARGRAKEIDAILRTRGQSLFPFQLTGVDWLAPRKGALLADDMGLGKTIQTLCSIPDNAPVVVVCPSVAKGVWQREANLWRPEFKVTKLEGRGSFRWAEPGEIVVTNYDILPDVSKNEDGEIGGKEKQLLSACQKGTVLISDEAQALKNKKAKRHARFNALADVALTNGGRTWALTATPILNNPAELWNILSLFRIEKEAFGSKGRFNKLFGGVFNGYGLEWGTPLPESADHLARVMLRRIKADVLHELPGKFHKQVTVNNLSKQVYKLLDKVWGEVREELSDRNLSPEQIITRLAGSSFEEIARARAALASAKIPALQELVEEYEDASEPVVVFSAHRLPIDALGKREGWATITGDTAPAERTRIEEKFQRGELKGVACTIKAGGVAITLTRANHAIFVDREWTPALNSQAQDRIYRIGQDRGVVITDIIADHDLDKRLTELLNVKTEIINASVEAARKDGDFEVPNELEISSDDFSQDEIDAAKKAHEEFLRRSKELEEEIARLREERKAAKRQKKDEESTPFAKGKKVAQRRGARQALSLEGERRRPATEREKWAAQALLTLSDLDPDGASTVNNVGFNKGDGSVGHYLAEMIRAGEWLTDGEWVIAALTCSKYHRQVGPMPGGPLDRERASA